MLAETLLGFDVRYRPAFFGQLWDPDRRAQFLLRPDVPLPLSVDSLVWPSMFDSGQGIGLARAQRRRLRLAGIPVPSWIGRSAVLWEDLTQMQGHLAAHRSSGPGVVVAVTRFTECSMAEDGAPAPAAGSALPAAGPPRWSFWGCDVADGSLVSGLMNCAFTPDEAGELRPQWAPALNDSHLFADPAVAVQFCRRSDARVPEHAPFHVYGLYLEQRGGPPGHSL